MLALRKMVGRVELVDCPAPSLLGPNQVRLEVRVAGICRTDLFVAQGRLLTPEPLILGHEFSGTVLEMGSSVSGLHLSQPVAVFPWLGCGQCNCCSSHGSASCPERRMLGVHLDGAFAEQIVVPSHLVYPLPSGMSFRLAAYAEPVAASLAVLKAPITPEQQGLVYGHNRIAQLTYRLLRDHGFRRLEMGRPDDRPSSFDFVVETMPQQLAACVALLKPGGVLVIKSRSPEPVALDLQQLIPKEITLAAVNYADFALSLLQLASLQGEGLLGSVHPLEDWAQVFEQAERDESRKYFLSPHPEEFVQFS